MLDRFNAGVCYYPEHWPAKQHARDLDRIAKAGFDLIRIGEGAWWYFEPREGEFHFDLFDKVIDLARNRGIKVIFGTPTYCGPAWIAHRYPEVLRWNYQRIPMTHGSRRNFNYTSPKYLDLSDRICTALASHYKNEKQIVAWQLDNEFNCHMDNSYAPSDTIVFQQWCETKYKKIGALNDAWGTKFWSQMYDSFEQIDLPHPTATYHNPSQLLDEARFISDCVIDFAKRQAEILRAHNPRWLITHNGLFGNIHPTKFMTGSEHDPVPLTPDTPKEKKLLDFFSHDQYPLFWDGNWPGYTANLVQTRSLSFPYAILEQQAGPGGQSGSSGGYLQRTPKPGEIRMWAFQTIVHGANLVCYFNWQTCPFGSEQHWHGLIDQDGKDTRRMKEITGLTAEMKKLPADFWDSRVIKRVAVLRDFDCDLLESRVNNFLRAGGWEHSRWIAELLKRHEPVDLVWPTSDFAGYEVIIAPHLGTASDALVQKLTAFVKTGGTLILGAQSGAHELNGHISLKTPPGRLTVLAGVEVEEFIKLKDGDQRSVVATDGQRFNLSTLVERIRLRDGTLAWSAWDGGDPLLRNAPAISLHSVGAGKVFYVAGYADGDAIGSLIEVTHIRTQPEGARSVAATSDVEAVTRASSAAVYRCLINHSDRPQRVNLSLAGLNLIDGQSGNDFVLAAFGITIIASPVAPSSSRQKARKTAAR